MKSTLRNSLAVTSAVVLLVIVSGCVNGHRATRTEQHSVEHVSGAPIIINNRNGEVSISGDPDVAEVKIEATISAGGNNAANANERLNQARLEITRDTSGTLRIAATHPTPHRSRDGASITVRVPDVSSVEVTTSNGRITAAGLDAPLTASTSNGRITVANWVGDAQLTTSNGRVTVDDLAGSLTVRTSNGRVEVRDLAGPADIQSSNGSIFLSLLPHQPGPIKLRSSNSSITAEVGPAFRGNMTLRTSNASINIDDAASLTRARSIDQRSADLRFSDDGPTSEMRTSNGRVTLRTRE